MESVDTLIARVMAQHPLTPASTKSATLAYYEAVHQELAPLARDLEQENIRLQSLLSTRDRQFKDMGQLLVRFVRWARKADPENKTLPEQTMQYLHRQGAIDSKAALR